MWQTCFINLVKIQTFAPPPTLFEIPSEIFDQIQIIGSMLFKFFHRR